MPGKKFRFSLQSVLKLRGYETERARRRLGRVVEERVRREQALRQAEQRLLETGKRVAPAHSVLDLSRQSAGLQQAVELRDKAADHLAQIVTVEDEARQLLDQQFRKEDAMVRLRSGEKEEFDEAAAHVEQQEMDEQGVLGYNRSTSSPTVN